MVGVCILLPEFASDGIEHPQSILINDSRLLHDVPTDGPEQSAPISPGCSRRPGSYCRCPARADPVEPATVAQAGPSWPFLKKGILDEFVP